MHAIENIMKCYDKGNSMHTCRHAVQELCIAAASPVSKLCFVHWLDQLLAVTTSSQPRRQLEAAQVWTSTAATVVIGVFIWQCTVYCYPCRTHGVTLLLLRDGQHREI